MAEKLEALDLEPDRTDAVPTDPDTHTPSANLPADYINKLIIHVRRAEERINSLIDEVTALRNQQQDRGNSYPVMLHRFILWGRNSGGARPGFIPDDTGKTQRLLFAGSPDWNSYGVLIRPTSQNGPQYAYVDCPALDMTQPLSVYALVRDTAAGPDGGAYAAVASRTTGKGYLSAYRQNGELGAQIRTLDDSVVASTFSSPGSGGVPFSGSEWKLVELAKGPTFLDGSEHVRRAGGSSFWRSYRNFSESVMKNFKPTDTRVAVGIIPRDLDTGELKGLAHCTLGALLVVQSVYGTQRDEVYNALRQQMQQDNVTALLPALAS